MKKPLFPCLVMVLGLMALPLGAQESTDDLFANAEPDGPADTSETVSLDAYGGKSVRFFQSLAVDGYYVGGTNAEGEFLQTPMNALSLVIGSDFRLDRTARGYAAFTMSYPKSKSANDNLYNPYEPPVSVTTPSDLTFTNLEVKELFLDYSFGDYAIVRVGRQTATWGQGRLFNPANLVAGIGSGIAAKLSTVVGPVTVTGVAIKNDRYYKVITDADPTNVEAFALNSVGSAGLAEYSTPWFTSGLSGFYQYKIGSKAAGYLKSSLWGTDLFVEGLGEYGPLGESSLSVLSGLYREFGPQGQWLKLQFEWLASGRGDAGKFTTVVDNLNLWEDQTIGLAATSDLLDFVKLKPSVLWLHSTADGSGQLVVGLVSRALPHIDLTLAVSRTYGLEDGRYIVNNPDPEDRTLALTLKLSAAFELKN